MHREIQDLFDLSGQVSMVTGGARDLGFEAAAILAAAGSDVVITSRGLERAQAAAARLREQYGVETLGLALDQRSHPEVARVMQAAAGWKGRIDVLVNNAGGAPAGGPARLLERDPAAIAELIELNLTGLLYCCREAAPHMLARGRGKIINIASIAGLVGRDRRVYDRAGMNGQPVDYAAAKAGVIGATRDLAGYLSPMGIYVNAISPGGFERGQPEIFIREYSDRTAQGRMGRDGVDLKGAVLFLASAASDYVTGHNLVVDGGFTMWK